MTEWLFLRGGWVTLLLTAMFLDWAAQHVAEIRHRELLPWCPWCRDDGGGEDASDPVPTGEGQRSA